MCYGREDSRLDGWQRVHLENALDSGGNIRMSVVDLDGVEVWQRNKACKKRGQNPFSLSLTTYDGNRHRTVGSVRFRMQKVYTAGDVPKVLGNVWTLPGGTTRMQRSSPMVRYHWSCHR
jgi:hypothetical protein